MAWTAPMTAVANTAFTAAQFNTHVRDNLLETAPAKALNSGSLIVSAGNNTVVERTPQVDFNFSSGTTSSTTYTNLSGGTSVGPSITFTSGGIAFVSISCRISNNTAGQTSFVGIERSGTDSAVATEENAIQFKTSSSNQHIQASFCTIYDAGHNPGSHTFTMKYKVSGGTGTFDNRIITVIPF